MLLLFLKIVLFLQLESPEITKSSITVFGFLEQPGSLPHDLHKEKERVDKLSLSLSTGSVKSFVLWCQSFHDARSLPFSL